MSIILKETTGTKSGKAKITETYDNPVGGIQVHAVPFVNASSLFLGCDLAFDYFCNSSPQCSWGDNRYSLISPQTIRDSLVHDYEGSDLAHQISKVERRICALPPGVCINLED